MCFIHFRLRCSSMSLLQHPFPYRDDETRVDIITHAFSDMFFFKKLPCNIPFLLSSSSSASSLLSFHAFTFYSFSLVVTVGASHLRSTVGYK
ncbi:hypothetical protein DPX39_010047200 [Trypanosoma brucei equiperdum]|uniref:Uncharacterized protein n=1 Tax=Trypanosoma brucei equiperdum TaxID=630700 RepID=A0A3L6LBZ6_9TRYP|nr:hypothetical protein DPX39_010047200 [Trypanosoma brucei equiperdum]